MCHTADVVCPSLNTGPGASNTILLRHTHTYGNCTRPLRRDSRGRRHSAVWRAHRGSWNTENTQRGSGLEEEEYQAPPSYSALHQICQRSRLLRHTASSQGCTGRSTHTGNCPRRRSEAQALLVLWWHITRKAHACTSTQRAEWSVFAGCCSHAANNPEWGVTGCARWRKEKKVWHQAFFFFLEFTGAALQKRGSSGVKGEWRGESEETTQYKCNCFFPPLPSVLSLVSDPVFTVNLYGPAGQRAPLTHYTLPLGPYNLYGNGGQEHGSLEDRECGRGRKREKVKMGGKSVKNEQSAGRAGNEEKKTKSNWKCKGKTTTEKKRKQSNSFTSDHTLSGVRDVVQGDVCPYVSTHFCLEGHPEGCWVRQDDIRICPLVAVVSNGCPHQETGTTGTGSVDLQSRK